MSKISYTDFLKYAEKLQDYKLCFGYNSGLSNNWGLWSSQKNDKGSMISRRVHYIC